MRIRDLSTNDKFKLALMIMGRRNQLVQQQQLRQRQQQQIGTAATGFPGNNGMMTGFGFPSWGDPNFYNMPAASSFYLNKLLGLANGSAVNINFGQPSPTLGVSPFLLGAPFMA